VFDRGVRYSSMSQSGEKEFVKNGMHEEIFESLPVLAMGLTSTRTRTRSLLIFFSEINIVLRTHYVKKKVF
jgi:hypothetical protein